MIAAVLDKLVGKIERAEVLDKPADQIAAVSDWLRKLPGSRAVEDLASGTPIGHPMHPLLVAIPIGSWTSAIIFDLVGDAEGARRLTGLGVLSAIPAAFTGHSDWSYTDGGERRVGSVHAALNSLALSAYAGSWLARRSGRRGLGVGLSVLGAVAITGGGWLGGHLAYALGVGVDTTAFQKSESEWARVTSASEVPAGTLSTADLNGVPLVLTRNPEGAIAVLADRCTHRGAPLHEGELVDRCVVCPRHGSVFALDGAVRQGPATRPQPAYEVDVRGDDVFVRRSDEPRGLRIVEHHDVAFPTQIQQTG